jgi:hypothetical protein
MEGYQQSRRREGSVKAIVGLRQGVSKNTRADTLSVHTKANVKQALKTGLCDLVIVWFAISDATSLDQSSDQGIGGTLLRLPRCLWVDFRSVQLVQR